MMKSNYKIAFRLRVLHSYFDKNICNCLFFKPAAETLQLQKRFGFYIRYELNGFDLYADSKVSLASLLSYINNTTLQISFNFEMGSLNSAFCNFTAMPTGCLGQMFFDSQSDANHFENDVLNLATDFIKQPASSITGRVSVHFNDILKFTTGKGYSDFCIQLKARKTQWQYFVINKSDIQFTNPVIKSNSRIEFDGPEKVTIQSGHEALLFSSGENLLQLSKTPQYKFALVDRIAAGSADAIKKSTDRVVFNGLPYPDPLRVNPVTINGSQQFSSPMYVFI